MSYKKRSKIREGLSYVGRFAKSKTFVTACCVGLGMASARADIVAYDAVSGATTWDFSTLLTLFVGVCAGGISVGATIFGIKRGWNMVKGFFY